MTATRRLPRPARPATAGAGHPRLRPIRYGALARFADWYHGWRDGGAGIPPKPRADGKPRIITTPHREATIRWALGGFEQERQRWEGLRASALERRAITTARRDSAAAALSAAQADLTLASRPLTDAERHRRRLGEERRPDSVVVQRRLREHHRRAAAARGRAQQAERELAAAAQDLAAATEQVARQHAMAQVRVLRIHQHAHKRMAVYRRTLLRWHKHGAWLSTAMAITEPDLPGWAFPHVEPPEPPRSARPGEATGKSPEPEEATPTSRLPLFPRTVFGSTAPPAHYVALEGAPEHFVLIRQADGTYLLEDQGHGLGPFIDGQPVKKAVLRPGGYFDFHDARYRISADGTVLEVFPLYSTAGTYDFIVHDLSATNRKQTRLANMSFAQRSRQLLAILGPSGAGKSSLFAALVGELTPQSGELYFLDMPLATHGPQIRAALGYVPQDESLFKTLTVRRLLRYAYRLRKPGGSALRDRRVEEVCAQLKITPQLDQLAGTLSGGQRKRVSIAMELLSSPLLLLLDEPTSGLDAGMDREVLTILSRYAEEGRTVMCITHSTEHLEIAGQVLVLAKGGAPVYSGPPGNVLGHFGVTRYADLMRVLDGDTRLLARKYQEGQEAALARTEAARAAGVDPEQRAEITRRGRVRTGIRQFWVLAQRQVMLLATRGTTKNPADRRPRHLVMGVVTPLMPLVIAAIGALLAGVVGSSAGLGPSHDAAAVAVVPTTLSLLVTLCMLSGQALTYGDVINDYATIRREHRTGTLTLPAMLAKWVVFAVVAALQALVITVIYVSIWPGPAYQVLLGPAGDLFIGLAAMTIAAMTLGLLISAVFKKLEQAVAAVTGVSIAQIAFNGAFSNLSGNHLQGAFAAFLPSRWGVAAAASSINLRGLSPAAAYHDGLWQHSRGQWAFDLAMLTGLGVLFLYLAIRILARRLNAPD